MRKGETRQVHRRFTGDIPEVYRRYTGTTRSYYAPATLGTASLPKGLLAARGDRGCHCEPSLRVGVHLEEVE